MITFRRSHWLLPVPILFGLLLGIPVASAEEDDEYAVPPAAANVFVMSDQQLEAWVFGGRNNRAQGLDRFNAMLNVRIDAINHTCVLSEAQKQRLQLAGRGDIKRFRDHLSELKKKFNGAKLDQNEIQNVFQEIQPLQLEWQAGIFGPSSLFSRVISRTLEPQQLAKYEQEESTRRKDQYKAKVKLGVAMMAKRVAMNSKQCEEIERLLLETTRPPNKFGPYDYYVVLFQVSKLPQDKLKSIFDDLQLRGLAPFLQQAKGLEQTLKSGGFLPEDSAPEAVKQPQQPLSDKY